ncbi:hypothetical protein WJU23_15685 [Prosthecobacter sp. SYSU 5D2]
MHFRRDAPWLGRTLRIDTAHPFRHRCTRCTMPEDFAGEGQFCQDFDPTEDDKSGPCG